MWYIWLSIGILLIIASIAEAICIKKLKLDPVLDATVFFLFTVVLFLFTVGIIMAIISASWGVNNYASIPTIHQKIQLEKTNKHHYYDAMLYNEGNDSNERKSASHVRWFKNGDFSESKDNKTWKQNYNYWYYNKSLITYHKMQLNYYHHPVKNWRYGISAKDLHDNISKPSGD